MNRLFALTIGAALFAGATTASAQAINDSDWIYGAGDVYSSYFGNPSYPLDYRPYQCMEQLSYSKGFQPCY